MKTWWSSHPRMQAVIIIVGLFVVLAIVSPRSPSTQTGPRVTDAPVAAAVSAAAATAAPTVVRTPAATPTPTPAPTPLVLRGTGQTATQELRLPSALSVVAFTHIGQSNFAVHVFRGDRRELLVNEIGNYEGVRPLFYQEPIRLSIEADGQWTARISAIETGGTVAASGRGAFVTKLFTPPGASAYRFTHDGRSNFAIYLTCADRRQLIQNEIGAFSGSKIVQFGRGPCLWEILADGAWSIAAQ